MLNEVKHLARFVAELTYGVTTPRKMLRFAQHDNDPQHPTTYSSNTLLPFLP